MKIFSIKPLLLIAAFCFISQASFAQMACCKKGATAEKETATSEEIEKVLGAYLVDAMGCKPTKDCPPSKCAEMMMAMADDEAKEVYELRKSLFALKSKLETSEKAEFSSRSMAAQRLVAESENDIERLRIIYDELSFIQGELNTQLKTDLANIPIPTAQADQIKLLNAKIVEFSSLL